MNSVEKYLKARPDWDSATDSEKWAYNMVRFYQVSGKILDHEIREITDGTDELMLLLEMNS